VTMRLDEALVRFHLSDPERLAQTATSIVWKVRQSDGNAAILKLLHPGETEELRGFDYLQRLGGLGAVQALAREGSALLMEHCPGPSLGDLARAGRDGEATEALSTVIQTLHATRADPRNLQPLVQRFAPLTTAHLKGPLAQAARIARTSCPIRSYRSRCTATFTTTTFCPARAAGWPSTPRVSAAIRPTNPPTPSATQTGWATACSTPIASRT